MSCLKQPFITEKGLLDQIGTMIGTHLADFGSRFETMPDFSTRSHGHVMVFLVEVAQVSIAGNICNRILGIDSRSIIFTDTFR